MHEHQNTPKLLEKPELFNPQMADQLRGSELNKILASMKTMTLIDCAKIIITYADRLPPSDGTPMLKHHLYTLADRFFGQAVEFTGKK